MDENTEFKLIDFAYPGIETGEYTVGGNLSVTAPETETFTDAESFFIASKVFTSDPDDVFSVYPADGQTGAFGQVLPHINLRLKTMPWEYENYADSEKTQRIPCLAYILLTDDEFSSKQIRVGELFSQSEKGVFFPPKETFGSVTSDSEDSYCTVLDIPKNTYNNIMPTKSDLPFLSHVKMVNLSATEDKITALPGYFSTVVANRFPADGENFAHLVRVIGYEGAAFEAAETVRLICIASVRFNSTHTVTIPFRRLTEGLSNNCGTVGKDGTDENERLGFAVKRHITRTGEETQSLYRSPLVPSKTEIIDGLQKCKTADGRIIYNNETATMDVSYSAAYEFGRILTMKDKNIAQQIIDYRKTMKQNMNRNAVKFDCGLDNFGFADAAEKLAEKGRNNET
ncbi:MAG: hypothetical protein LBL98_04615 [Ruminococcus sp.]|jgi:hypothetical protein|nr:hypothetical protein [Ruminococcus sp.]